MSRSSFWWKYNLHYVCVCVCVQTYMPPAYVLLLYKWLCRHTFYVISFNKATHHFTMPYSIYNRNLYYVFEWVLLGSMDIVHYVQQNLPAPNLYSYDIHQLISVHTFYMGKRSNHLGMYNKINKSSGSIWCIVIAIPYSYTTHVVMHVKHAKKWRETRNSETWQLTMHHHSRLHSHIYIVNLISYAVKLPSQIYNIFVNDAMLLLYGWRHHLYEYTKSWKFCCISCGTAFVWAVFTCSAVIAW